MVSVPPESFARFDFRSQIIDNCEFFVSKYDVVQVITTKVGTGSYVAYAVRSNEKSRDALLCSERCAVVQDAIESLHNKSCEAVQNYVNTNGFSYPPDLKKTKLDSDDEDDDGRVEEVEDDDDDDDDADVASVNSGRSASSTVALSYWGSSDDEAAAMTPASSSDPHAKHEKGQRHSNLPSGYRNGISNGSNNNHNNSGPYASNFASKRRSKPPHVTILGGKPPSPHFGPDDSDDDVRPPHRGSMPPRVQPVRTSPKVAHGFHVGGSGNVGRCSSSSPITSPLMNHNTPCAIIGNNAGTTLASSNGSGSSGMGMGGGMSGMNGTNSYRPPPPPPGWTGPPMPPPPPPPMRVVPPPAHFQSPPQYYAHTHAQTSPAGGVAMTGQQSVPAPPLPPPAVGMPMRAASLQYKASMPNLGGSAGQNMGPSNSNGNMGVGAGVHPSNRLYDVRLTIRWPGRGETKILESTRPSVRALQEMAVAYARTHVSAFDNGGSSNVTFNTSSSGSNASSNGNGQSGNYPYTRPSPDLNPYSPTGGVGALRACVRRAFFGPGEVYDMSAYRGDDLTKLFNVLSAGGIPRFEVEVESVGPKRM